MHPPLRPGREEGVEPVGASDGRVYATMASINYNIQLVSVRRTLLNGESGGIAMFPLANPDSIGRALGNSYVYMSLARFFAAFVFTATGLEHWIKWLLLAAGLAAPMQLVWSLFDVSYLLEASLLPWIAGAVGAPPPLAVLFRRARRTRAATLTS